MTFHTTMCIIPFKSLPNFELAQNKMFIIGSESFANKSKYINITIYDLCLIIYNITYFLKIFCFTITENIHYSMYIDILQIYLAAKHVVLQIITN